MAYDPSRKIPMGFGDITRDDLDEPRVLQDMLMNRMNDNVLEIRHDLIVSLERGKREIESALEALSVGGGVNPCGILQSTASTIDSKAAQLHDAAQTETHTAYSLGFAKPDFDTCWKLRMKDRESLSMLPSMR